MNFQNIDNQKGEIEFRKKLYSQQVEQELIFDDEFDANGIENILKERMKKTRDQMITLRDKGIPMTPYIEIGAERCQRSLVMENDLLVSGVSVDISYDMLKSCDYYKDTFHKSKSPVRVCCDANHLPFLTNSVPFVFCYETLHHFPEPIPITTEIHRVLAPGGCFFFDEEPFKQALHFNLYKGDKVFSQKALTRSMFKKILDHFFSAENCNETEHGIIENDDISIKTWKQAFQFFDNKDIVLEIPGLFRVKLFNSHSYIKNLVAYLFGGRISGLCTKDGNYIHHSTIDNIFICPSCKETGSEELLKRNNSSYLCSKCSKTYPVVNGVVFLFSYTKFEALYPEIFKTLFMNQDHQLR